MTRYLERDLVEDATPAIGLGVDGTSLEIGLEFDYRRGRVDIIGVSDTGELHAFEAKLTRWRHALDQAYRSTTFANFSYVLLPLAAATRALLHRQEFERRGVGIIAAEGAVLTLMLRPRYNAPIQPWLTIAAIEHVNTK